MSDILQEAEQMWNSTRKPFMYVNKTSCGLCEQCSFVELIPKLIAEIKRLQEQLAKWQPIAANPIDLHINGPCNAHLVWDVLFQLSPSYRTQGNGTCRLVSLS
jgi:hypothetical protein